MTRRTKSPALTRPASNGGLSKASIGPSPRIAARSARPPERFANSSEVTCSLYETCCRNRGCLAQGGRGISFRANLDAGAAFHMAHVPVVKGTSHEDPAAEGKERERFGALLKQFRLRLNVELKSLGPFSASAGPHQGRCPPKKENSPKRSGSAASGMRCWSERRVRVSAQVLARISEVLMLSAAERDELFSLALPELRSVALTDRSTALLAAFARLRSVTRRLWAATTEARKH